MLFMTTGTAGNDQLTNAKNVYSDTINGLAGDDVVTIDQPNNSVSPGQQDVADGGDGYDILVLSGFQLSGLSPTSASLRYSFSMSVSVAYSNFEEIHFTGGLFASQNIISGATRDIFSFGTSLVNQWLIQTNGGDPQMTLPPP